MSAFLVSDYHIDALLNFAKNRRDGVCIYIDENLRFIINKDTSRQKMSEIGQILKDENQRSVNFRYSDKEDSSPYEFRPIYNRSFRPVEILKGCACYDYQACETGDYRKTKAAAIVNGIRHAAIHSLPEWEKADGWDFQENSKR